MSKITASNRPELPSVNPTPTIEVFRLNNDELARAINVTMRTLNEHHIKYNSEILKATEKHYIALITEELRRARVENPL